VLLFLVIGESQRKDLFIFNVIDSNLEMSLNVIGNSISEIQQDSCNADMIFYLHDF